MIDNPFTLVRNCLWSMVKRNPELSRLVSSRNMIELNADADLKPTISHSDLPELLLLTSGGKAEVRCNSSQSKVTRRYTWVISTGRISPYLYDQISWELFRSMVDWDITLLGLEWPEGCNFIVQATDLDIEEGLDNERQERGINGWTGFWTIEVDMHFVTNKLRIVQEFTDGSDSSS